ncbi:MAG TPA: hypothetical protein VHG92_01080, partial [Afifellaceae bacterium]|nr:hypothetical protein [Afifellaceae bacterium]
RPVRPSGNVPEPDFAAADHIVIQCPACGTSEAADPAVLSGAPMIVCRKCGETWPVAPRRRPRRAAVSAEPDSGPSFIEAERRPLVTFSSGVDAAWAARIEADAVPEPKPPRWPRLSIPAAAVLSALFLAAFIGARERAVAIVPDLAGLYATVGIPVNLDGLLIEAVEAERSTHGEEARMVVRGAIRNVSRIAKPVPPLSLTFRDGGMASAGWRHFDPPLQLIPPGETAPFLLQIDDAPRQAADIVIRFRRPAEQVPGKERGGIAAR